MKFYSEITKEMYDTEKQLAAAEALWVAANDELGDEEDTNDACELVINEADNYECHHFCKNTCASCSTEQSCKNCKEELTEDVSTVKNVEKPSKKELAAKIDQADANLKNAHAEYEIAKQQIEELSKTYLESIEKILTPAKQAVKDAEQAKYLAIKEFNDAFGAYQVTLTGAKAAEELMKALNRLETTRSLFRNFGWPSWF